VGLLVQQDLDMVEGMEGDKLEDRLVGKEVDKVEGMVADKVDMDVYDVYVYLYGDLRDRDRVQL